MNNVKNTTKTILFASLIVAMILPFSGMNYAVAEELDKETAKRIANQATNLMEMMETEENPKEMKRMQERLEDLLVTLNSVGLYTEDQFEVIKVERLNIIPGSAIVSGASSTCSSCNDPTLNIKVGFDYRLWGFFGTANGGWDTVTTANPNGYSQALVGSWGADYAHTWHQYYLSNGASSANTAFSTIITNNNDGLVHDYGSINLTVVTTTLQQDYSAATAYAPINGNDKVKLVVVLTSIV